MGGNVSVQVKVKSRAAIKLRWKLTI